MDLTMWDTKEWNESTHELSKIKSTTSRPISMGMEGHMFIPYVVLDKGVVRVMDYMGNDDSITQAARISYGKGTKTVRENAGLINYLLSHQHNNTFRNVQS